MGILETMATQFVIAVPGLILICVGMSLAIRWEGFVALMEIGLLGVCSVITVFCWQTASGEWMYTPSNVILFTIKWIIPIVFTVVLHIGSYMFLINRRRTEKVRKQNLLNNET